MANYASALIRCPLPELAPIKFASAMIRGQVTTQPVQFSSPLMRLSGLSIQPAGYGSAMMRATLEMQNMGVRGGLGGQIEVQTIDKNNLANGALAADSTGRAKMATDFFGDEATFTDKVAVGVINTARLAAGILSATAAGRAKMAADFFESVATFSAKVAAGIISGDRLVSGDVQATKFSLTGIKSYGFTGRNLTGAVTLTGAAVNDRVLGLWRVDGTTLDARTLYQGTITVVNQIQQSSNTDLSTQRFLVLLIPAAA